MGSELFVRACAWSVVARRARNLGHKSRFPNTPTPTMFALRRLPAAALAAARASGPRRALATATAVARAPPAHHDAPAPFLLEVLRLAQWGWGGPRGELAKTFEFRDARTAARFRDQALDLAAKIPDAPLALAVEGAAVRVALPLGGGPGADPTGREVAVAQAVDDVGAELQLGGRWN